MTITTNTPPALNDLVKFGPRTTLRVIMVKPAGKNLKAATKGKVTHVVGFEDPKSGRAWLGDYYTDGTLTRGVSVW